MRPTAKSEFMDTVLPFSFRLGGGGGTWTVACSNRGLKSGGGLKAASDPGAGDGITSTTQATCICRAISSAEAAAAWASPSEPWSFRHTPGWSFNSACRTRTPAVFSMASRMTMAGDQPPTSTKTTASSTASPYVRVRSRPRRRLCQSRPSRWTWGRNRRGAGRPDRSTRACTGEWKRAHP